jgi:1,4-dihydroxy-2-naphthoate octaprenyltransferase
MPMAGLGTLVVLVVEGMLIVLGLRLLKLKCLENLEK